MNRRHLHAAYVEQRSASSLMSKSMTNKSGMIGRPVGAAVTF